MKHISEFLLLLPYRLSSRKKMSAFFLETSNSENMDDLKGRGCTLTLLVSKNRTFFDKTHVISRFKENRNTFLGKRISGF